MPAISITITVYLVVGALTAAWCAAAFKHAIDHSADLSAEERRIYDDAEAVVGRLPGGMPMLLLIVVLFWPMTLAILIRNARQQ